jgi:hypothetical protein
VRELSPDVWHWQSPHPGWNEEQWWPELVSSYGIAFGDEFLLFDPLSVPNELRERATAVVLTASHHERDARRLDLPVYAPPADTWQDWVEKFRVDPDDVRGRESEDLAWLRAGEGEGHFHGPGAWPFNITAFAAREQNDLVLWLPAVGAIVTGDSLCDFGDGLDIQLGGRRRVTRDDVARRLRPCLTCPSSWCCQRTASPRTARHSSGCFPDLWVKDSRCRNGPSPTLLIRGRAEPSAGRLRPRG